MNLTIPSQSYHSDPPNERSMIFFSEESSVSKLKESKFLNVKGVCEFQPETFRPKPVIHSVRSRAGRPA